MNSLVWNVISSKLALKDRHLSELAEMRQSCESWRAHGQSAACFHVPFLSDFSASTLSFKRGGENKFTLKCQLYLTGIGCLEICVKKDSEAVLKLTGKEV